MGDAVWRHYQLGVFLLLVSASGAASDESTAQGYRVNSGLRVRSALVTIVTWDVENRPGQPLGFRHLGSGFLATETGWIVTLGHVLADRPANVTCSVIAFAGQGKMTELPVVEGPLYPPASETATDLCLLRVKRILPGLDPVDFAYRVRTTKEGRIRLSDQVLPCDEVGVYATLLEDAVPTPGRASVINRYARKGIVSALSRFRGQEDVYFLDVVGVSGYSGGPVFRWDTGAVIGVVTALEARRQRFEDENPQNHIDAYFMHGLRAVRVKRCVDLLLRRGETLRFIDPFTGERFQFSLRQGHQPVPQ